MSLRDHVFRVPLGSLLLALPLAGAGSAAQQTSQPLSVIQLTWLALTRGSPISDVLVESKVVMTAGADEEAGEATFKARGRSESEVVLNFAGGQRQETRQGSSGVWSNPDGQAFPIPVHNTWTPASWFFPALTIAAWMEDPEMVVTYLGQETRDGKPVHHVRVARAIKGQLEDVAEWIERLSATEIFIDPETYLPVSLAFNFHPDDDASLDLPVEIRYGDYRDVGGVKAPFLVQKLLQNSLLLDLAVTRVLTNSGLPDADFNVQ